MRFFAALTLTCILAAAGGCRTGGASQLREALGTSGPMVTQLLASRADVEAAAAMKPSEVWERLGMGPGGRAARIAMLTKVLREAAKTLGGVELPAVFEQSFGLGPEFLAEWFAGAEGEALYAQLATRLDELLESDPRKLDRFPTVPLAAIPKIQAAMFAAAKPTLHPAPPLAYPPNPAEDAEEMVTLGESGCAAPKPARAVVLKEAGLYGGHELIDRFVVPCFHDNAAKLARILSRLANTVAHPAAPKTEVDLRLRFAAEDADDASYSTVRSYEELLALLDAQGFTVEIFSTRVVADFYGVSYSEDGQAFRPVRANLWIAAKVDGEAVRIPAEHGEIGLMVHRDGKRFAEVRYYLGMPDPAHPGIGSYWRPRAEKDTSWSGAMHERVETFSGYSTAAAKSWLESVARAMRGFQAAHDRIGLPFDGYGVLVCADSLVLASAAKQTAEQTLSGRITNVFPVVRAGKALVGGIEADVEALVSVWAGVDAGALRKVYPADTELELEPERLRQRLRVAFPVSGDARFGAFPEFVAALKDVVRVVP